MDQGRFSQPARPGIRRTFFCAASLLLLLVWADEADAATKRRRGLIMLGRLTQSISLSYDVTNSASENDSASNSATTHGFDERYGLRFPYAIYSPRLLRGEVSLDLGLYQSYASSDRGDDSDSTGSSIQYSIGGIILQRKPYPIRFNAFSEENRVRTSFAPTYTIKSTGYSVSTGLRNRFLPVSGSYSHNESTTKRSGGRPGTSTDSDTVTLGVGHAFGISTTSLTTTWEESEVRGEEWIVGSDVRKLTLDISNTLDSQATTRQQRRLVSRYHYEEDRGSRPRLFRELTENLNWGLGRALTLYGSYSNRLDETVDTNVRNNGASVSLSHSLYQNLRTTVGGHWSKSEYDAGSTVTTGGSLRLGYSKKLPGAGSLSLNYAYTFADSEQDYSYPSILLNQETTVPASPDPYFAIEVEGAHIIYDTPADIKVVDVATGVTYVDGVHYTVRLEPDRAVIEVQGILLDETRTLRITYRQRVNRDLTYTSTSHSANVTLTRQGGAWVYNLGGTRTSSEQTSGSDAIGQTSDVTTLVASVARRNELGRFAANYRRVEMGSSTSNALAGQWSTSAVSRFGNVSMAVTDQYATTSSDNGDSRWSNTLAAYGSLSRPLYRRIAMRFNGRYQNRWDEDGVTNTLSLGLNLSTSFRRNRIMLDAISSWSSYEGNLNRTTSLHLTYYRYF